MTVLTFNITHSLTHHFVDFVESWSKVVQQAVNDQTNWEEHAQKIDSSIPTQDYTGLSVDPGI